MTRSRPRRPADGHLNAYRRHGHGHGYAMASGTTTRRPYRAPRRERRIRRRHVGMGIVAGLLVLPGAISLGLIVTVVLLGVGVAVIVKELFPLLLALALLGISYRLLRSSLRRRQERTPAASPAAPESGMEAWRRARADFDRLRSEYSAHECDPMRILRRPALSDVSVPSTARFVDAFAEAQSLDTDTHPGAPYDAAYAVAVAKAQRAWQAAQDAADRIRLSSVPPEERGSVERVLKLLTTARDSDSEPERLAAYARARSELDRLDRAGIVHLPRTARAALDEASRGALPS